MTCLPAFCAAASAAGHLCPPNFDVPFGRSLPMARPRMFPRKEGFELATKLNRFSIVDEDELLARA